VLRLNEIKGVYLGDARARARALATVRDAKAYLQVVNTTEEQRIYIPTIKVYEFETNENQILDSSSNSKSDYLGRSILDSNSIANSNYLGNSISNSNSNLNFNTNLNYLGSSSSNLNPNSCCLGSTIPNFNFNSNSNLYESDHNSTSNSNLKFNSILISNFEDSNLNSRSCFIIKQKERKE